MGTIVCIGSGNMGNALMKGAAGIAGGEHIFFTDTDQARAQASAKALGAGVLSSNTEACQKGDYIFLAVKPQVMPQELAESAPVLGERKVLRALVSMAA
ncbi:MAG: NAD(P)-binding domain-containing protein, partial [Treponema sp.]|nr:NAD(P)-binding domain-containing protein [Treponema sp.]